jgi:hypothetical protein
MNIFNIIRIILQRLISLPIDFVELIIRTLVSIGNLFVYGNDINIIDEQPDTEENNETENNNNNNNSIGFKRYDNVH